MLKKICGLVCGVVVLMIGGAQMGQAGGNFNLQFAPDAANNSAWSNEMFCNRADVADANCARSNGTTSEDTTPFIYEKVQKAGVSYYHLVVGDDGNAATSESLASEVYIRIGAVQNGVALSDSGGDVGCLAAGTCTAGSNTTDQTLMGNGYDPLNLTGTSTAANTGNGSGNPQAVEMRQVLTDTSMSQTFLKDVAATKPRIDQSLSSGQLTAQFTMDASAVDYTTDTGAGPNGQLLDQTGATPTFVNNTAFSDPILDGVAAFDMATDADKVNLEAARYTYAGGVYSYLAGATKVDPTALDWQVYRNPAENSKSGNVCQSATPPAGC